MSIEAVPRRLWTATERFRPVLVILVVLFLFFALTQDGFLTGKNLRLLLTGSSILWVLSLGMTFVLISGGVDLSAGAVMAFCGIALAKLLGAGVPTGVAIVVVLLIGAAVGAGINGFLIGRLGLSFFVVTLGSMTLITGVVSLWSNTETTFVRAPAIENLGVGTVGGIATAIWIMAITLGVALYFQHRTYAGRNVYAVGGSPVAARLAGIRTVRTTLIVYGISGLAAGIGGLISVGRIGAASPQIDNSVALQAAAAVLLGGTSLFGGAGGVGGTVFGVLFIGVLQNGLSIAGVQSFWQQVVTGLILVLAVLGDRITAAGGLRRFALVSQLRLLRTSRAGVEVPPAEGAA